MPLCDTVLRLAAAELFEPYWSETILEEVCRNLVNNGRSSTLKATARIAMMRVHFPEAIVYGHESLIPAMTNHPKDRHVLAAAVKAGTDQLVTENLRDFGPDSTEPFGIEVRSPDEFLLNVIDLFPGETLAALRTQAAALTRPPLAVADVLRALRRSAPQFAQVAERLISDG